MATVEQLLAALGRRGDAQASELATWLQVSRPTVTRLLAAAGDRLCRMGKGPATRYARTRSLPSLGTRLSLHRIDETGTIHRDGELHLLAEGRHWLERVKGESELFEGLPPFAADMSPQGYIGRTFSLRCPELALPQRVTDWTDDDCLVALALRGEDCVGDFILGDESLDRYLATPDTHATPDDYPRLARASGQGHPGSSVGGEHLKFATRVKDRHVIVKFAGNDEGAAVSRWKDLLVTEHLALEAIRDAGHAAAATRWLDAEDYRFLEVERFDRVGLRGRRGLLSLGAIDNEYLGVRGTWTQATLKLCEARFISEEDARQARWLDVFGQLIGNTDRHFGNLAFFTEGPKRFRLAPAYDMLPMMFAPVGTNLVEREYTPQPPNATTLDVWPDAARRALAYWERLTQELTLSAHFRERCAACAESLRAFMQTQRL
ncbi:type II toxin-antitoxin system HipA family toxin YjjJ [Myxococcus sp. MISCRS1]|uniref:type II toxin-antitoxin system HipA family toxin YjjJ n=1 Tax=Myxococcus sp. MISCRS1 TaxID=2996786 RepID=UPI00226EC7B2|nr:type II toxin-antitoxin system HipA family toxin YjjJ [Myxococcus sp. MISCRS1]MCY1000542.1 type II toxin-antitoxin system HipA family toxin YjjJ [Myxococcus sp. MISCRS1]